MSKTKAKPQRRPSMNVSVGRSDMDSVQDRLLPWLTHVAFILVIALVFARCTFLETVRDPVEPRPNMDMAPRAPGVTASLVLDLLCCLPALLVLTRRVIDRTYVLRRSWTHALFGALALWAVLSPIWAADKFDAAVTAPHLLAAAAMLWAMTQLVRSWLRLRIVAGVCLGLLLVYTAWGLIHKFV